MNDVANTNPDLEQAETVDEMTMLKSRARMMGIVFSNNIGIDKLREKIEAKLNGQADVPETPAKAETNALEPDAAPAGKKPSLRKYMHDKEMKLVRLRITNLDPKKKDLPGEIFTIANRFLGTVRKYVPYGEVTDDGYHVPYCIYTELESRRFLNIRTAPARNGRPGHVTSGWAKEFALEILPPLTPTELKDLATAQLAAGVFTTE